MGEGEQGRSLLDYPASLCTPKSVSYKCFPRMLLPMAVKTESPDTRTSSGSRSAEAFQHPEAQPASPPSPLPLPHPCPLQGWTVRRPGWCFPSSGSQQAEPLGTSQAKPSRSLGVLKSAEVCSSVLGQALLSSHTQPIIFFCSSSGVRQLLGGPILANKLIKSLV